MFNTNRNPMPKQKRHILLRALLGFASVVVWILSLKPVRNWLWGKATKKAKEKIIDAEAKMEKK